MPLPTIPTTPPAPSSVLTPRQEREHLMPLPTTPTAPPAPSSVLTPRQEKELGMWREWKASGEHPDKLRPLLGSMRNFIYSEADKWTRNENVSPAAVRAEFMRHAVNALSTYDPNHESGAKLTTHVQNRLRKASRFVKTYQNAARIPERRVDAISGYDVAHNDLEEELGRPPSAGELAERLGWSVAEVGRMGKERMKAIPSSSYASDPTINMTSGSGEALHLFYHDLPEGDERSMFEHTFGLHGKETLKPTELATKFKVSPSKISRIRNKWNEQLQEYHQAMGSSW